MSNPLFAGASDEVCGRPHPEGGRPCERPKGHDACLRQASGGSDAWVADHAGTRALALQEAYWRLREHASGYRGADAFRRAMAAYEDDRADPVACRRAMNHEWYARGIEAAARTLAELLETPEHEIPERRGGDTRA